MKPIFYALLLSLLVWTPLGAQLWTAAGGDGIPFATDLKTDGDNASMSRRPIVVLVSAADCHYCELLKSSVFPGMETSEKIILRELSLDAAVPLVDFQGRTTTHQEFTERLELSFTPTVLFLDGGGKFLADPLVGVSNLDFYAFYLEQRIEQSRQLMKSSRQPQVVLE